MRIARFILPALYLLQCVVIWVTCYFAITGTLASSPTLENVDPNDDSFGTGIAGALIEQSAPFDAALEFVFFLVFFFFSAVTCVLLFRQKELVMALVFAAAGIVPPVISALLYCSRGDLAWQVRASSEILLGVATIFVLIISLWNRPRAVSGTCAINA